MGFPGDRSPIRSLRGPLFAPRPLLCQRLVSAVLSVSCCGVTLPGGVSLAVRCLESSTVASPLLPFLCLRSLPNRTPPSACLSPRRCYVPPRTRVSRPCLVRGRMTAGRRRVRGVSIDGSAQQQISKGGIWPWAGRVAGWVYARRRPRSRVTLRP